MVSFKWRTISESERVEPSFSCSRKCSWNGWLKTRLNWSETCSSRIKKWKRTSKGIKNGNITRATRRDWSWKQSSRRWSCSREKLRNERWKIRSLGSESRTTWKNGYLRRENSRKSVRKALKKLNEGFWKLKSPKIRNDGSYEEKWGFIRGKF